MPTFRKKPVEVEARQFDGDNGSSLCEWMHRNGLEMASFMLDGTGVLIPTLEGVMRAEAGDWIVRGTEGEFYPCKPAPFAATFEEVS